MASLDLVDSLLNAANERRYLNLAILLAVPIIPTVCAWISKWLTNRKIARLYEARLKDKDAEIERLVAHNKRLENALLKGQRP